MIINIPRYAKLRNNSAISFDDMILDTELRKKKYQKKLMQI
jgi:hypothetical protein